MYKIIDNFLPEHDFSLVKGILMGNNFPWYYNPNVADEKDVNNFYFVHNFFIDFSIQSPFYSNICSVINKLEAKAIIRIKGNLYTKTEDTVHHPAHKDYLYEHKGAIFYVNTNNGFTVFEDGTKIESIENRLLIFDPHKLHNSTTCTDQQARVNINFNYF